LNSEAHATAGEETREYQDDDLDPEAFRRGGDDDDDDDEAAMEGDEDGPEEEDPDDDDGTASGEKCVASSVFEDVVLSRTNQTLETANAAELGNDAKGGSQPGKSSLKDDSDVGDIEAGGGSTQAAVRRSYRDHKKSGNLRRQLGLLLARDELRLRRTRQVARQSFLYAGAFYLNWTALSVRTLHPRPCVSFVVFFLHLARFTSFGFSLLAVKKSTLTCASSSLDADNPPLADRSRKNVLPVAGDRRPHGTHPGLAQLLSVPRPQTSARSEPAPPAAATVPRASFTKAAFVALLPLTGASRTAGAVAAYDAVIMRCILATTCAATSQSF
jgi:hypothetical protein